MCYLHCVSSNVLTIFVWLRAVSYKIKFQDTDVSVDTPEDEEEECICGSCVRDIPGIPHLCCHRSPCLSKDAEGKKWSLYQLFFSCSFLNSFKNMFFQGKFFFFF
jgi:hypothetical protein